MTCVKTGAEVHLAERNEWCRADVYRVGDVVIVRASSASRSYDVPPRCHFRITKVAAEFRDASTDTIVALDRHVVDFGHDGRTTIKLRGD